MRRMPFNLQGQGEIEAAEKFSSLATKRWKKEGSFFGNEPISVLDTRSPSLSPPTSSSTLSSSLTGSDSISVASVQQKWEWLPTQHKQEETLAVGAAEQGDYDGNRYGSELQPIPPALQILNDGAEKCELSGMEFVDNMLPESGPFFGQEQSLLGWIMGEGQDPTSGLKQLLQSGGGGLDFQNNHGFGMVDTLGDGGDGGGYSTAATNMNLSNSMSALSVPFSGFSPNNNNGKMNTTMNPSSLSNCKVPIFTSNNNLHPSVFYQPHNQQFEMIDIKPQAFNFTQNQAMFVPSSQTQQGFCPSSLPDRLTMRTKSKAREDVLQHQHQQQVPVDQLFEAAKLVETGNLVHAQAILARLNHQLSPIGKPLQRAAFLFKEALQLLLLTNKENCTRNTSTPLDVVHKINAYKAFSEVSPLLNFTNFTCNQAILEALQSYDRIHIVDFDIGFGGQWASFMQEIRMRVGGIVELKITAIISPSYHFLPELKLAQESLSQFAKELGIPFQINFVNFDSFNPASLSVAINVSEGEALAVNCPVGAPTSPLSSLPLLLRFVKKLSPKIVVSVDRGSRGDLPFSLNVVHSLQSHSMLLESIDVINDNPDIVQKIEKFYLLPTIERKLIDCQCTPSMPPWRTLFTSAGLSPITFSNIAETQAEYVLEKLQVRGFHVEKSNASLMLCWQRHELASVSAWRC
ncbi:Scarecrow-like protein [Thalictrum thalictroides]|uniref:Scarecrow-like protein n=1 Tax=Thalictrum thalictroides TaxID=46969 RepID=A0A7J6WQJ9_THATH|nr:Scarecrow-like protein [Thalictrum thalictroides]